MRTLFKLVFLLLLIGLLLAGGAAYLALAEAPKVIRDVTLSHQDIARARAIVQRNDPRALQPGTRRTIELDTQDLNLAANYLLQRALPGSAAVAELRPDTLELQASLRIDNPSGRPWANVAGTVSTVDGDPHVAHLQVGRLPVPAPLADLAFDWLFDLLDDHSRNRSVAGIVEQLELHRDRLRLSYRWDPDLIDQARSKLLGGADRAAMRYYVDHLVELQRQGTGVRGSLAGLLQPMFGAARERSRAGDPVAENLALLTVLGTWSSNRDLRALAPEITEVPRTFHLRLEGRTDFGRHFLISAALAARGDSALSDAVGLFKEIADTDRGSGFSFTDIAADRAGTRLGATATRSAPDARRVQQLLADGLAEEAFMPRAGDLPEYLDAATFKRRFGEVGSPAYQVVMDEIGRRIDALPLYRE